MTKRTTKLIIFISLGILAVLGINKLSTKVEAATACDADINQDSIVDISDYSILASDYFKSPPTNTRSDITRDNVVDISDYSQLVNNYFASCTPDTPAQSTEWTQFAGNAQRTSYTPDIPALSWKYKWQWNGADNSGQIQANHLTVPDMVQPIVGGNRVYMVAANALYALDINTGNVIWSRGGIGVLNATPAYLSESVYLPSSDGRIYKINASTGAVVTSFLGNGAFNYAPLVVGTNIYAGTAAGTFYSINTSTMAKNWEYVVGSPVVTPAAFSSSRNIIIVNAQDLNVHALNTGNGSLKWKVKPTPRSYQSGNLTSSGAQFEEGWPVVAEKTGIVFVRYRLDWDTLWTWNPFPDNNAQIQSNLQGNNRAQQALFALSLDTGSNAFTPAVGNGGAGDGGTLPMGPQPVIKEYNGKEVAYIIWRNKLTCASGWCDGREDATMGEMVLDNNTVSGYTAGQVRFVRWIDIQTDEMLYISMGGNVLFNGHWLINSAKVIDPANRGANVGATYTNPIPATDAPYVIWRQCYCPPSNPSCNPIIYPGGSGTTNCPGNCPFNASTRYCSGGLFSYGDQRGYPAGFYQYHNARQTGSTPFTITTKDLVIIKTGDGGIMALGNGNPAADADLSPEPQGRVAGLNTTNEVIDYSKAINYVSSVVTAQGKVAVVDNHLPKAMYIGFQDPHDGALLVRVFAKDISKFNYDLVNLKGKTIQVTGLVTLYWPEGLDPEIVVTEPAQIKVLD